MSMLSMLTYRRINGLRPSAVLCKSLRERCPLSVVARVLWCYVGDHQQANGLVRTDQPTTQPTRNSALRSLIQRCSIPFCGSIQSHSSPRCSDTVYTLMWCCMLISPIPTYVVVGNTYVCLCRYRFHWRDAR